MVKLLGFPANTVIPAGTRKKSGKVNINLFLRYITIGWESVDIDKNFDRHGRRSNMIATIPIEHNQNLNHGVTFYENVSFSAPLNGGQTSNLKKV